MKSESKLILGNVEWSQFWLHYGNGTTPSTMQIHPDFNTFLLSASLVLDLGCGFGETTEKVARLNSNVRVIGIDINQKELLFATKHEHKGSYAQANGVSLPFAENTFDLIVMLGTLGGIEHQTREKVLKEVTTCLSVGGSLYVSEIERIIGDDIWDKGYKENTLVTGEDWSSVTRDKTTGEILFFGRHFVETELSSYFSENGLLVKAIERLTVTSTVNPSSKRGTLCVWGTKK